VSLGLLTVVFDLTTAMALLLIPSFVTNIWQALIGGHILQTAWRIWPFLFMAMGTVWLGSIVLTRVDLPILSILLGALILAYGSVNLAGFRLTISDQQKGWAGPFFGAANGILTGMTGSFVFPGVLYLQAIGLPRDRLIQSMGMLFTVSTIALAGSLKGNNLLLPHHISLSALAVLPALAGMVIGQIIRKRISETQFRRIFFCALILLGFYIVLGALLDIS
jgi:uncharacterized membrane protein YfcA